MSLDAATEAKLIAAARTAAEEAYAPYSNYQVGSALLFDDGTIITGTNVENASYGLALCAETVAVARALANRPKLLLADEPTANVDPSNQQQIVDLIRESCVEDKIAMVMVTHSMEVSSQFDRVDELANINLVMQKAGT